MLLTCRTLPRFGWSGLCCVVQPCRRKPGLQRAWAEGLCLLRPTNRSPLPPGCSNAAAAVAILSCLCSVWCLLSWLQRFLHVLADSCCPLYRTSLAQAQLMAGTCRRSVSSARMAGRHRGSAAALHAGQSWCLVLELCWGNQWCSGYFDWAAAGNGRGWVDVGLELAVLPVLESCCHIS